MSIYLATAFLILFIAYMFYNAITLTEYFKEVAPFNEEKCQKIDGPIGIEDIVQYDNYLIGGASYYLRSFIQERVELNTISSGQMIALNTQNNTLRYLPIINYPTNIPFHPHGISLYQNKFLYVINHSITKGERVEVLKINNNPLTLTYERSIVLPDGFNRITNNLVVIDKDEFYITVSFPIGRDNTGSFIKKIMFDCTAFFTSMLRLGLTYVYHYKDNIITKIPYSNGIFNNGISFDKDNNLLYIAQTISKRIRVLELLPQSVGIVRFNRDINLQYAIDNISFDSQTGIISAGFVGRLYDIMKLSMQPSMKGNLDVGEIYGGALQIDTKKNDEVTILVLNKNKLKMVSSGITYNNFIYLSSFGDNGLLVCSKLKQE